LAREFELSGDAIREWVKQAALDEGLRSDGLTTPDRRLYCRCSILHMNYATHRAISSYPRSSSRPAA
jgi:hypothetical protein